MAKYCEAVIIPAISFDQTRISRILTNAKNSVSGEVVITLPSFVCETPKLKITHGIKWGRPVYPLEDPSDRSDEHGRGRWLSRFGTQNPLLRAS